MAIPGSIFTFKIEADINNFSLEKERVAFTVIFSLVDISTK